MNWYWPESNLLILKILNKVLNYAAKVIWFNIANADMHDNSYKEWWTEFDRIRADTWFLRYMLIDSNWKLYKTIISYLAYFLIRIFWYKFFTYK